jgi:hypothetical protein
VRFASDLQNNPSAIVSVLHKTGGYAICLLIVCLESGDTPLVRVSFLVVAVQEFVYMVCQAVSTTLGVRQAIPTNQHPGNRSTDNNRLSTPHCKWLHCRVGRVSRR